MNDLVIDESNLLSFVDEYSIFCHYLGYSPEIKVNYSSPLRAHDLTPSFGIFQTKKPNREFFWKDSGGRGDSGDVIKLVKLLHGFEHTQQAVDLIKSDFGIGPKVKPAEKIVHATPVVRSDADIRIVPIKWSSTQLDYWKQFNIDRKILDMYRTTPFSAYFIKKGQKVPFFAPHHAYAYRVYDRYQLYFPFKESRRFFTDMDETQVHGIEQLQYNSPLLIITKSRKDVKCLRSFGYEAVSPRSENTPMPEKFFAWADRHYERKLVLFDTDLKHRGEWYPYPKIYVPEETGCKDISDFVRDFSPSSAAELLRQITSE